MPFDYTVEGEPAAKKGFDFTVESEPPPVAAAPPAKMSVGEMMLSQAEFEQQDVKPVELPLVGAPGTFTRGVSKAVTGLVREATTPEGVGIAAALAVPVVGPVLGAVLGASAVKQAAQAAGEFSVTKNPETLGEAATVGALGVAGTTLPLLHIAKSAPATAATLESSGAVLENAAKATHETAKASEALTPPALESNATPAGVTGETPPATPTAEVTFTDPTLESAPALSAGPGAASPGDVPQASQLAQLTEAIKPTEPVTRGPVEQLTGELARAYDQITSKAESALDRLKGFGAQALDTLKGEAPWTDFKDALGKFSGENNRNSFELQEFTREAKRVMPDPVRREAIVNWIQADGDPAVLAQRAAASRAELRPGYEVAQRLTPDEMTLANNVRSYLDAKLQEGMDAGLLKAGIENYVTQLWDRPNPVTNKLIGEAASGKLSTDFKFARQRVFDSYFDGEQAGFKPRLKDIGGLTAAYDQAFSRAIAGRQLVKALHEGKASDGLPLVEVSGVSNLLAEGGDPKALLIKPKVKPADLVGYKPIDHPALRGWKWAGTDEKSGAPILYQGDMVVHPEIYTHLKNVLSTSALRQNAFFRGVLEAQSILKQSKLALSGFHFTQEGVHAAAHRVNPLAPEKVDFSIPDQSHLVDHGLQVADYRAYQAFTEGISGAGSIYERIPVIGKWLTRYNEYLFQEYIPRLKMTMAMDALERNRARFVGKLSDDQILEKTANQSNAAFGALNYDMLGRNKTLQDFLRMGLLAPDFLEARARFASQALTKTGTEQRVALALQAATLYVGARLLNQALDGDPHWEPKYAFDILYNKRQYGIRSVVEDTAHLLSDPARFIANRMAPIAKAATEFATGRDWRGVQRTSWEQIKDVADWLLPITADRQAARSTTDTALAASGVTVRSATAQQRLYEQLTKFKEAHNLVTQEEKMGMRSPSEYAPLRNALTVGSDAAARREYERLLHPADGTAPKTPAQIREHFVNTVRAPFSGSSRIERAFLKSLDKAGNALYLEARQERKDLALKFVDKQRQ